MTGGSLVLEARAPFCWPLQRLPRLLPAGVVGAYLLLADTEPIYAGRSDNCLRSRLLRHPLAKQASHVLWEACRTAYHAYCMEAFWFHKLRSRPQFRNRLHPARPASLTSVSCPFCAFEADSNFAHSINARRVEKRQGV